MHYSKDLKEHRYLFWIGTCTMCCVKLTNTSLDEYLDFFCTGKLLPGDQVT